MTMSVHKVVQQRPTMTKVQELTWRHCWNTPAQQLPRKTLVEQRPTECGVKTTFAMPVESEQ